MLVDDSNSGGGGGDGEEVREQQQRLIINQLRLLNRLLESQEKGEKITFDLENPHVRKEIDELMGILHKKLEKEKQKEKNEINSNSTNTTGEEEKDRHAD